MLKFYYTPGTCARAAHIALEEAGAEFEPVRIDFSVNQQRSEGYLALNPKGRVPAIVTDRGILTENVAILGWVAATWPAARLAPLGDDFAMAELTAFNAWIASTFHVAHAHRVRGARWADEPEAIEAMKRKVTANMRDCCQLVETTFLKGPWVMGEGYTTADPYLFTICNWLAGDGVEIADFPRLAAHFAAMQARPAVRRALAREAAA